MPSYNVNECKCSGLPLWLLTLITCQVKSSWNLCSRITLVSFLANSFRFVHCFWSLLFLFSVLYAKAGFQHGIAQRFTYPLYNQRTVLLFLVPHCHKSFSLFHNFFTSGLSASHPLPLWFIYSSMSCFKVSLFAFTELLPAFWLGFQNISISSIT